MIRISKDLLTLNLKLPMKNIILAIKIIAVLSLLFLSNFAQAQSSDSCTILHEGYFKYGNTDFVVEVKISGTEHIEYHDNGKYFIKSKLDWISDCEYNSKQNARVHLHLAPYLYRDNDETH